jgi:DNA-binding PadR family transcriptional regulator
MSGRDEGGRWLHSGLRRDICVVVAALDQPTAQRAKSTLSRRYDDRIEPKTFYGALEALVDGSHLERETEGIHDRYSLTPAGERLMQAHFAWVHELLDAAEDGDESDATAGESA